MAISASAIDMILTGEADEPLAHGGDLGAARRLFPDAPEPFIDLSTGINPNPYPLPRFSRDVYARLPAPAALDAVAAAAARAYGAPSAAHVVPAPGTQILLPLAATLVRPGSAAVWVPSYPGHASAAISAGHDVKIARTLEECGDAALIIICNPNNPDGRLFARADLLTLAKRLRSRGGLLVVDEAFMDVGPAHASLAADVAHGNIVVLRSFGKFFGLAGVRLGFAMAAPPLAARLRNALGPWAVSGPALAAGIKALADSAWIERTRKRLAKSSECLDAVLADAACEIIGGTSLFRLVRSEAAPELFRHLGAAGIWVRAFPDDATWLRFGLPAHEKEWRRLRGALASFRNADTTGVRRVQRDGKSLDRLR